MPSELTAVPARASGWRPEAPATELSHLSRKYSIVRETVSEISLRSFKRRSGGILKSIELVSSSSSNLLTKKPMKLEMISNAADKRCDIPGYSALLSFGSSVGKDDRRSIRRRLMKRYEKGLLSKSFEELFGERSEKSRFGAFSGYACSREAARRVYAALPVEVGLLLTSLRKLVVSVASHFGSGGRA